MARRRKYINPKYSLLDFFKCLNDMSLRYVVLRWFDNIEVLSSQEDIDILVSDQDIEKINRFIVIGENIDSIKIDIFSVSGLLGSGFAKLPYFPRNISSIILKNRQLIHNLLFAPTPKIYLLSLIFHIVYHKAEASGLPILLDNQNSDLSTNKYLREIKKYEEYTNIEIGEYSLVNLKNFLKINNWVPPIEWIRKIAYNRSSWLMSLYPKQILTFSSISIFIIRSKARRNDIHIEIMNLIEKKGMSVLDYVILNKLQKMKAKIFLRSGKWDKGPNKVGGGNPYSMYIILDQSPKEVMANLKIEHPYLVNLNFLILKKKIREITMKLLKTKTEINCVHSCDDELESDEYLSILIPDKIENLYKLRNQIDSDYQTDYDVLKDLSRNNRRAKVELIDFEGHIAICKTYKNGKEKYFNRELFAYKVLQKNMILYPNFLVFLITGL